MFSMLIVDNNRSDREGIRDLVNWDALGITIVGTACNGVEGLEKAMLLRPDFILSDISMPQSNGIQMTEQIKAKLPDVKVIFMSCYDEFQYAKSAIHLDVSSYLLKPIKIEELTEAVSKVSQTREEELLKAKQEEEMKQFLQERMPFFKQQFIRDLIHGSLTDETEVVERAKFLGMHDISTTYSVIYLEIDDYELTYAGQAMEHKYLLIHRLQKVVEGMLLQHNSGFVIQHQAKSLIVTLFIPEGDENRFARTIDLLTRFKETVNRTLNVNITIGIGHFSTELHKMHQVYKSAEYAVKSKFYSEGNMIILAWEVNDRPANEIQFHAIDFSQEISLLLETDDESTVDRFLEQYYKSDVTYRERQLRHLAHWTVHMVELLLNEKNLSLADATQDHLSLMEKVYAIDTIYHLRTWLKAFFVSAREVLREREGSRLQRIVDEIRSMIDEKYAIIENVEQVTASQYISSRYANSIFKQLTGITIFDYLLRTRMNAAKTLLSQKHCKIYEVAELVGYKSTPYFSSVFREFTGLTPKEYRNKYENTERLP